MIYRISIAFALLCGLVLLPGGTVSAQSADTTAMLDLSGLPPGIAKKVEPLLGQLMVKMHEMGMDPMPHPPMHMTHLQALIDQLPPGILVQVLEVMLDFDMDDMMAFHQAVQEGLLDQQPGQVLNFANNPVQ